jgi:hypothetical protein
VAVLDCEEDPLKEEVVAVGGEVLQSRYSRIFAE